MGAKYGAATSLRSCCVVLGDQDGWGTNRLSKAESILGTGMSQNLSRGRRHAWMIYLEDQPDTVHPHGCGEHFPPEQIKVKDVGSSPRVWGTRLLISQSHISKRFIPTGVGNTRARAPRQALQRGSSPRVWGTRDSSIITPVTRRFIPTGVGNTAAAPEKANPTAVHPHGCGEHVMM